MVNSCRSKSFMYLEVVVIGSSNDGAYGIGGNSRSVEGGSGSGDSSYIYS